MASSQQSALEVTLGTEIEHYLGAFNKEISYI